MFGWFTSKSVERTSDVLNNPFSVYDLTFIEWEQMDIILHDQRVYVCKQKSTNKSTTNAKFEVIFKKDRLSVFSVYRNADRKQTEDMYKRVKTMLNLLAEGITDTKPTLIAPVLKDIVELTNTHHNWTVAHVAAKVGLELLFAKRSDIKIHLNAQSKPDFLTPLHLAIESAKVSTTRGILALKPKLDLTDEMGNAAIHFAAMSDKEILELMTKEPNILQMLEWKNKDRCSALHLACFTKRYDNVIFLLEFGLTVQMMTVYDPKKPPKKPKKHIKQNNDIITFKKEDIEDLDTEDMQFGGTPLHWAKHRRALERLIGYGFDLNVRNLLGETAVHIMVKRMRLKCLIGLLCFGAKVHKQNKSGDTPLHYAVRTADVTSSQALIIFDSKLNMKNQNQETPRHIAAQLKHTDHRMVLYLLTAIGAERCEPTTKGCNAGCVHDGTFEGQPYHKWPNYDNEMLYTKVLLEPIIKEALTAKQTETTKSNGARMLCLDGGGVRGLITLQMLIDLEKQLKAPVRKYFDWVSGTSTGSILGVLLCAGRSLTEIRAIYFRFKDKIMSGPRPYSSKQFETLLEEEVGPALRMCDILTKFKKHLIVNAILIDRNPAKLHVFRSYDSPDEVLGLSKPMPGFRTYPNCREQIAWKACRASGAAPTYFRMSGAFLDGGLAANNPTVDALTEFKLYNNALKAVGRDSEAQELDLVVSFGTGTYPITPTEPVDLVRLWSFNPRELYKNTNYVKQLGNLLINQVCATEGHIIDRAQSWCSGIKTPYFRVNPVLSEMVALDETSDVEICNAMWETKAYMYAMRAEVYKIIQLMTPPELRLSVSPPNDQKESHSKSSQTGYKLNIVQNNVQLISNTLPQSESTTDG